MTALALVVLMGAVAGGAPQLCGVCHPDTRVEFEKSIHRSEEVRCTSCHGGNPDAESVEAAHRGGFRGKIRHRDIPELCATCHSDAALMRPYNLPSDQFALYQTSHHGKALARGDENVAVCTDCHGVHAVLSADDPRSPVHPRNTPATCAKCHSDPRLMSTYGWKSDPYERFMAGRHGEALMSRQDSSSPGCATCHGAHGATPPGVGDINKVCGQCHTRSRDNYLASPHHEGMTAAGIPECSSCHGHHKIGRTSVDMLETVCLDCHDAGSSEAELGLQMRTLYTTADGEVERADAVLAEAAAVPLYIEDYKARLEEARTALIEAQTATHSLDLDLVDRLTVRARSIGNEVESEAHEKVEGLKWRRVGLLVFWFYLIVTIAVLVRFRRRAVQGAAGGGA